jgi:hypothetical protein
MNILKFIPLMGLALIGFQAQGQNKHKGERGLSVEERVEKGANHAEKELGLRGDQKEKWKTAARERMQANDALRQKMKGSTTPDERKKMHEEAKANNKRFDEAVSAFLDADQKPKYETLKKKRMEKRRDHIKKKMDDIDDED